MGVWFSTPTGGTARDGSLVYPLTFFRRFIVAFSDIGFQVNLEAAHSDGYDRV